MWTLIPMVHYWFKTSILERVNFMSYWSNHAIIDSKKMEHLENANWSCLENANWSCTPVYLLYSWWGCYARNTEKLFCWCLMLCKRLCYCFNQSSLFFWCTQHAWWQLIKLSQSIAGLLCFKSCAVVLAVPRWSFCRGWDTSPRKPPILPLLRSFQLWVFRTACVNYKH